MLFLIIYINIIIKFLCIKNVVFIWLPSNADIVNHPDNRGGKFNISLFNELKLNEQWEVGLHEMFYHGGDWPHLEKSECRIIVKGMYDARHPDIKDTLANEDVFTVPGEKFTMYLRVSGWLGSWGEEESLVVKRYRIFDFSFPFYATMNFIFNL